MRQPSRRIATVKSASSATVSAVIPPAVSIADFRHAPSAPGTTVMQFSKSKARFSMFWLVTYSSACQRVSQRERLPTFTLPATAPTLGSEKCRSSLLIAAGSISVSASMVTTISLSASLSARLCAAAFRLFFHGRRHHHVRVCLANQVRHRNQLVARCAQGIDDPGQCRHRVGALAAAIVEQDDVAVSRLAHHVLRNLLR